MQQNQKYSLLFIAWSYNQIFLFMYKFWQMIDIS